MSSTVSDRTLAALPGAGEGVALYTDLLVREDLLQLFGFPTLVEKEWHRLLMTVQGIGAKASLAILGALGPGRGRPGDRARRLAAIKAAPGVGPKIAQRVVNELKDKAPAVMAMGGRGARDGGRGRTRPLPRPAPAAPAARAGARRAAPGRGAVGAGQPRLRPGEAAAAVAASRGRRIAAATDAPALIRAALRAWRRRARPMTERPIRPSAPSRCPRTPTARCGRRRSTTSSARPRRGPTCAVFIESARRRGEAMDHTLFHGPPGLGKTTLAQIMARELGVNFRMTSGPVLAKAGDLAAILTNLEARDVLFIDEIHRLNPAVEEVLYPALEDFELDLVIGEGPAARTVRIELQPFTLVGATTRLGLLTTPLRDRFGIPTRLEFYTVDELHEIVTRGARLMGMRGRARRGARDRPAGAGHAADRRAAAAPGGRFRAGRGRRPA